jgi:RNA polymerase sigma-70 factor (ECF subfamily)
MEHDERKPDDQEMVARVLRGNVDAFEPLMARYREPVLRIVSRHVPGRDVDEVAQDAFVRVYESLPSFKGEGSLGRWISSIAVRTCYDYWRRAYRCREVPMAALTERHLEFLEEAIAGESETALREGDVRREAGELLDWALARLCPEERMVLELVYLEGLSMKETSELLGWSVANVKVRAFRSRRKLERLLAGTTRKGGRVA